MANKFETQRDFPGDAPAVLEAVVRAVRSLGWNLQAVRPEMGRVAAKTPLTAMSFGEQLTIDVQQIPTHPTTTLKARSELPFGFVDFGRNRKHVERLLVEVQLRLADPAQSPSTWGPDPTGRHELRYWDGSSWTENVSDAGVPSSDPLN